ncbi:MAG: hypothetical protein LAT77_02785 [Aliidiomarina sp.]|uniref:thiamine pyrophosphate-binding protein n=1 Tax=Aliidiomarina sp. TaxID=1872439 RepID=UPI0025C2E36A|nr:thiamine pyrophosphate-binding protein [Aliidiomarina sp.]MCH8500819.1 hypothetical protein [Aliidiomarina sp.]
MLLVDALINECKQFGVKEFFGIPGDFVLPLFQALQQRNALPLYYLSHEPSAVFAADAAARISNNPSVVILTYGAGALNAVNAVAQAYVEHVPLVVIGGFPSKQEIERGLAIHHQARTIDSQRDVFREVTTLQVRLDNPKTAAEQLRLAFRTAKEKSLPVFIEIPRDATNAIVHAMPPYQPRAVEHDAVVAEAAKLVERLRVAKRPVILADVDVRRFHAVEALEVFAAQFNLPILNTFMGRASIDQNHPCYAGTFLDRTDTEAAELIRAADLVLQVGVIKTDSNFAAHADLFPKEKVVELQHGGPQLPLAAVLEELSIQLASALLAPYEVRLLQAQSTDEAAALSLTATSVVQELDRVLSDGQQLVPFVSDVGDCLFASLHAKPSLLLAPAFYASMGYAVPAALGVQAVTGLRPVVLVGDGAFLMTGLELGHCRRYGFAPVVVLFNNKRWDMINAFAPDLNCTELNDWDYVALAKGMGGAAYRVTSLDQFAPALELALQDESRFSLIEVMLDASGRTARLNNFAQGFLQAGASC